VVHVRPVAVLRTLGDGFLDEATHFDSLQRDESIEVGLRRFTNVVGNRPFQIAFGGFEFPFNSGVQRSSSVALLDREVREVFERETLVLVDAVLFELSSQFVFEGVTRTEDGASNRRASLRGKAWLTVCCGHGLERCVQPRSGRDDSTLCRGSRPR
jgi:hypothetical protein